MTEPTRQNPQHFTLTPSVVQAIKLIAHDAAMEPRGRLYAVMMLVFGQAWYLRQQSFDPQTVALPKEQWLEVAEYLTHGVALDAIAQVNLGLDWLDLGPCAYDPD